VHPDVLEAIKCVSGLRFGRSEAVETEPVKPVAEWAVDATLRYCAPQVAAMIALQRVTGMRSGEVAPMRTADINTQGAVWTYSPPKHKTKYRGHVRTAYLGPKAQDIDPIRQNLLPEFLDSITRQDGLSPAIAP
jgi:integrase